MVFDTKAVGEWAEGTERALRSGLTGNATMATGKTISPTDAESGFGAVEGRTAIALLFDNKRLPFILPFIVIIFIKLLPNTVFGHKLDTWTAILELELRWATRWFRFGRSACHSSATGTYLYNNKIIRYNGDLRAGVRHGKGKLKFRGGAEYDGQWLHGRMAGHGIYRWPDAMVYEGQWEAGLRSGKGTLTLPNGERWPIHFKITWPNQSKSLFSQKKNHNKTTLELLCSLRSRWEIWLLLQRGHDALPPPHCTKWSNSSIL